MKNFFIIAIAIILGFAILLGLYSYYKKSDHGSFFITTTTTGFKTNETTVTEPEWTSDMAENPGDLKPEITNVKIEKVNNLLDMRYHIVISGKHLRGFEGGTWLGFYSGTGQKFDVEARDDNYADTGKMEFDIGQTTCVNGYQMGYKGDPCEKSITIEPGGWAVMAKPWGMYSNTYNIVFP